MIHIMNDSNDPYFNLALEEYFIKCKDLKDDILILWQNEPTIVIGKNQNTFEELNLDYVEQNKINVVRRLSGGGAVYHDSGNLNFTIIKVDGNLQRNDFSFFALPVIACLKKYGVEAVFNGRNDILIDGKKFSGNAQYFFKNKVLHHGTLLFSSDLQVMSKALKVQKEKFESKGIKSIHSRVTNINAYLDQTISLSALKKALTISMFNEEEQKIKDYALTQEDIVEITQLRNEKYRTWAWNFGQSPEMNYHKEIRFPAGSISIGLNIKEGIITRCKLYGDFFEVQPIDELERQFENCRYDKDELELLLGRMDIEHYIYGISNQEFSQLLF